MLTLEIVILILIGHFIGDYLFQNNYMALQKKTRRMPLLIHCTIYSVTIYLLLLPHLFTLDLIWIIVSAPVIFLTHICFDGTHVIDRYFNLIKGRSWDLAFEKVVYSTAQSDRPDYPLITYLIYTAIVSTVVDNFLHLILMFGYFYLIF